MEIEAKHFDADAILAEGSAIEELTLYHVRKATLPRMQGLARLPLKHLGIRWLSAPDLTGVPLPESLRTFTLWHSRTKSMAGIEKAAKLTELYLSENSALENLAPIRDLPKLQKLSITGGFNGAQKIATLEALRGLAITSLELNGIEGAKLDLSPVATLPLAEIDIWGRGFAPEELAKICAAFPDYYAQILDLRSYDLDGMMLCKTCGGLQKELFLRGRNFLWCPVCKANGLTKVLAEFDAMVEAARATATGQPGNPG